MCRKWRCIDHIEADEINLSWYHVQCIHCGPLGLSCTILSSSLGNNISPTFVDLAQNYGINFISRMEESLFTLGFPCALWFSIPSSAPSPLWTGMSQKFQEFVGMLHFLKEDLRTWLNIFLCPPDYFSLWQNLNYFFLLKLYIDLAKLVSICSSHGTGNNIFK